MFKNIGSKLKTLAKILAIIEIICFSFMALLLFSITLAYGHALVAFSVFLISILLVGFGFFVAWLTNCQLYAFGEFVDANSKILEQSWYQTALLERIAANSGASAPRSNIGSATTPQAPFYTPPTPNFTGTATNSQNTASTVNSSDIFAAPITQIDPPPINDQNN